MEDTYLNIFKEAEDKVGLLLLNDIKLELSKLKGNWSFTSGNGCYFFLLDGHIMDKLPKKLQRFIDLMLKLEKDHNYYTDFSV